jgi:hypothetical protein
MTGDEMERAIEFILRNQAGHEAKQAEYQAEYKARQAEIDAKFAAERAETDRQIRELAAHQDRTQENLDRLTDLIARLGDQVGHLRGVVSALAEGQRRGRDDIDALVKLVGGLVKGRNGGAAGG